MFGLYKKATKFLGDLHHKARNAVKAAKDVIHKVKSFGTKAVEHIEKFGAGGRALVAVGRRIAETPVEALGGRSVADIARGVESGVGTAERVLAGDRRELEGLARAGLSRYGGRLGREVVSAMA
jgi:hypothetical protein